MMLKKLGCIIVLLSVCSMYAQQITVKEAFLEKWGNEMTQIFILRKEFSNILYEKGLNDLFKQGKFGELIRKLL